MAINGFTVTPTSGQSGVTTITVSATSLTSDAERGVWIDITAGTITKRLLAFQDNAKHHLDVTPPRVYLPSTGGSATFHIDSDENWVLANQTTWATFSQLSGSSTSVTVSAGINNSVDTRSAMFMINTPNITGSVYVEQPSAASLNVTPNPVYSNSGASSTYMTITSNSSWTISTLPDWVTASQVSGTGNTTVVLYCTSFTGEGMRTGTITINYGDGSAYQIGIIQYGKYWLSVEPDSFSFDKEAGSTSFTLTSDCQWRISSSYATSISPASGSGSTTIYFSYPENTATAATSGYITIEYGRTSYDSTLTIPITQEGRKFIEATPTAITFSYQGGSSNVTVKSNVPWTAGRSNDWLSVSPTAGTSGETTVTISADTYTSGRTGQVTFHDEDYWAVEPVEITQSMALGVNPTGLTFGPASGEVKTIEVLGSDTFYWWSDIEYFNVSLSGNIFTVTSSYNKTGSERNESIYLTGRNTGIEITVPLKQVPYGVTANSSTSYSVPYSGLSVAFSITSNYNWDLAITGSCECSVTSGTSGTSIINLYFPGVSTPIDTQGTVTLSFNNSDIGLYNTISLSITYLANPSSIDGLFRGYTWDTLHLSPNTYLYYFDTLDDLYYYLAPSENAYGKDRIMFKKSNDYNCGVEDKSSWLTATIDDLDRLDIQATPQGSETRTGFVTVTAVTGETVLRKTFNIVQYSTGGTYNVTVTVQGNGNNNVLFGYAENYVKTITIDGVEVSTATTKYNFRDYNDHTIVFSLYNPSASITAPYNIKSIAFGSGVISASINFADMLGAGSPSFTSLTLSDTVKYFCCDLSGYYYAITHSGATPPTVNITLPSSVIIAVPNDPGYRQYTNYSGSIDQLKYYAVFANEFSKNICTVPANVKPGCYGLPSNLIYYSANTLNYLAAEEYTWGTTMIDGYVGTLNLSGNTPNVDVSAEIQNVTIGNYVKDIKFTGNITNLHSITCLSSTAPIVSFSSSLPNTGTFSYPAGADYSFWLSILPEGWTIITH